MRPHPLVLAFWALAALALPAAAQSPVQKLGDLFAPPNAAELQAVRADWAERNPSPESWSIVALGMFANGARIAVVSYRVEGNLLYALVRFPKNAVPTKRYPVLVFLHGGKAGTSLAEIASFDQELPSSVVRDEFFLLAPSYRGEPIGAGALGSFTSEGEATSMDREVDDTIGLIDGALAAFPQADRLRVAAIGNSRSGGVGLLLGIRDARIRQVVDLFGMTDMYLPSIHAAVAELLRKGLQPETVVLRLVMGASVEPWVAGQLSLGEARLALIRSSPAWFVADLPPLEIHHGAMDTVIEVEQSDRLDAALAVAGAAAPPFQYFRYPEGQHGLANLPGAGERIEVFFAPLVDAPSSFCGTSPNSAGPGAWIDWHGSASVAENDWTLLASRCPPNVKGLFFYSDQAAAPTPFGQGKLCLGGTLWKTPWVLADPTGSVSFELDLDDPMVPIAAGTTWRFQLMYRDGPLTNLSDGLAATFLP
jgi:acetyl esterase/lipase